MNLHDALPALLLLCACQSSGSPASSPLPDRVIAPDGVDSAWDYLAAKYDRDADGRVTPAEYTRPGGEFAKLDRNGDGVLDSVDYPSAKASQAGRTWDAMPSDEKQRLRDMYSARAVLLTYWQPDPDAEGLHRDAMLEVFASLDSDRSDEIDESEFACATDARPWGGPGRAWPLMLAAVDEPGDGDGRLDRAEVVEYHGKFADDEGVARGAPAQGRRDRGNPTASDGAAAGSLAPDFRLPPVAGGTPVRLSDFRGSKPVALIFGSYT